MIRLVGPGGAGKSTASALLAQRLGFPFVDLDEEFVANFGEISRYLDGHGYDTYARRNVEVYFTLATVVAREAVLALSSGFMTYRPDIHPDYESCCRDIALSPSTFVLIPSLEFEACVGETVRRQLLRPFARSADGEEQVIRTRLPIYLNLPAKKVETMRPVREVVDEIVAAQHASHLIGPTCCVSQRHVPCAGPASERSRSATGGRGEAARSWLGGDRL